MIPIGEHEQKEASAESPHAVHESVLAWLGRRKAFPRCLQCGSEDNVALKIGEGDSERRPIVGFRHDCGGELYLTTADLRIAWAYDRAPNKYLDEQGILLT